MVNTTSKVVLYQSSVSSKLKHCIAALSTSFDKSCGGFLDLDNGIHVGGSCVVECPNDVQLAHDTPHGLNGPYGPIIWAPQAHGTII